MASCSNFFLCFQYFVTYGAVLTFCKSCFGTCGSNCCIDHFGVASCSNFFLCFQYFVAYGAFNSGGKTGFCTGCRYFRDSLCGVARSTNYKISFIGCFCSCFIQEENATIISAALVVFHVSGFGTGCGLSVNLLGIMSKGINVLSVCMRLIILTGKGHYASACTGRFSGNYTFIIIMTKFRLDHDSGFHCTVLILKYTVTLAASVVFIVAVRCTGCVLSLGQSHAMSKGMDLVVSGIGALLTILICLPTDSRTGCCLSGYCYFIMAGGYESRLNNGGFIYTVCILEYLATCSASVVFNVTVLRTGCCLCIGLGHAVAKCVEGLILNGGFICTVCILEHLTTCSACVVFVVAVFCTGCRLCIGLGHAVAKCIGGFRFIQNFVAYGAFNSGGKTGCSTGCRHCRDDLLGMTKSINIFCFYSLCLRPIYNKGCIVRCPALSCASSICFYNFFYFCFYCFNMVFVIGTYTLSGAVSIVIRPRIGCFTISMAQCGNIFYILILCFCPSNIKCCCVCCPTLCCTGCWSLFCTGNSSCRSLNMAAVSGAYTLSGADPLLLCSVILPVITCNYKVVAK